MKGQWKKIWLSGILFVACMMVSNILQVHAADEDAKTAITLDNGAIIQAYNDISSFRTEGAYTKPDAPSNYAGYIFAGWYSDENGEKPLSETAANQASSAYAKFVPKEVLSIKAQVSSNLINPDTSDDGIGAIRFVTTVDSKHYKEVGFIFDIEGGAQDYKVSNNFVYTELFAVNPATGERGEAEKLTPEKTFSPTSKYFKTCTFYKIPEEQYGVNIKATPFWVTLDGTTVKAELLETESTKTVEQGKIAGWAYVSADTAIASDDNPGTEAKPFATLNKALEKVQNGGVVCVMGNYGVPADFKWAHHTDTSTIYITGYDETAVLDFTALGAANIDINDPVEFTNIELNLTDTGVKNADGSIKSSTAASIFANGYKLKIDKDVTFTSNTYGYKIYGGANGKEVASTNITILSGYWNRIFGGGVRTNSTQTNVSGDVYLHVGGTCTSTEWRVDTIYPGGNLGKVGNINAILDGTARVKNQFYGIGSSTTVESTTLTVTDNAYAKEVYGGGWASDINGTATITIEKEATAGTVYGGTNHSKAHSVKDTNVIIKDSAKVTTVYGGGTSVAAVKVTGTAHVTIKDQATVKDVYGGSNKASTSNTVVDILGGTVTGKVFGGSLSAKVDDAGTMLVRIAPEAKINGAISGASSGATGEKAMGIIVVDDYKNNDNATKITAGTYQYLVNVSKGGTVDIVDGKLDIKPVKGFNAVVTDSIGSDTAEYSSEASHTLPALTGDVSQIAITVDFERISPATVYLSTDGSDNGLGTEDAPYATLNRALEEVKNGGTVCVLGEYKVTANNWTAHKGTGTVIITGGKLDFSTLDTVDIKDAVTFTAIELGFKANNNTSVFANGNKVKIDENVTFTNSVGIKIYGGANGSAVDRTDLTLLAGNYFRIFGGGRAANGKKNPNVNGDINLSVAGDVTCAILYSGGENGIVGNTNTYLGGNAKVTDTLYGAGSGGSATSTAITLSDKAYAKIIMGGGWNSSITGAANITIGGSASATTVYGGTTHSSVANTVTDTNVIVKESAKVTTVYGGSWDQSNNSKKSRNVVEVTGTAHVTVQDKATVGEVYGGSSAGKTANTAVNILGGTVTGKIYGGSNGTTKVGTTTITGGAPVTGAIKVLISPEANVPAAKDSIYAQSINVMGETATGIFIITDYRNNSNGSKIAESNYTKGTVPCDYRVDVSKNGVVDVEGKALKIVPNEGFKAVVTDSIGSDTAEYGSETSYTLPALTGDVSQITVTVDFVKIAPDTIYVSDSGDDNNAGSQDSPYKTLDKALVQAEDSDIISIVGTCTVAKPSTSWVAHEKDVTITGGTIDFTAEKTVNIRDAVTFKNVTMRFQNETTVYANGNRLKIDSDAKVEGVLLVYGAGNGGTVANTDVTLLSGDYKRVFGGGASATVKGDTNLYIAGEVNKSREFKAINDFVIYGAGSQGTVDGDTNVYVGGNVNRNLNLLNQDLIGCSVLYGGGSQTTVEGSTYVTVEGNAQFSAIYGNGYQGTCKGDTHVTVRGNVNSSMKGYTDHKLYATLNGGGSSGNTLDDKVMGDAYVMIDGPVCFMQIWGGGNGTVKSEKAKPGLTAEVANTHVTVTKNAADADIMSIYGGSYYGVNKNTSLVIEAGKFQQVFGGSLAASMTGNVDLKVLGGTVTRRIYGGCYNNYPITGENAGKWETSHYVTGNISVTIGTGANITINSQTDNALVGRSRRATKAPEEKSIIIVKDYEHNKNLSKVGKSSYFDNSDAYDFCVKATMGGNVTVANGALRIVPDAGYKATVTYGSDSQEFTEAGTYTLPANAPVKSEITVTFTENSAN